MHFGIMLVSFWDHVCIILGPVGFILGALGTIVGHLGNKLLYGGPCIEFNEFVARFWTLWGSPFSPLGVTILFPWVWNGENSVFCGQPDSRLYFGTKSDQFLGCLGW